MEVIGPPGKFRTFHLAPDGKHLAADLMIFDGLGQALDIARYDLQRAGTWNGSPGPPPPLFSGLGVGLGAHRVRLDPAWPVGPVGRGRDRPGEAGRKHALSGGTLYDWPPDGRFLLWQGNDDLWIVPLSEHEKPYALVVHAL